MGGYYECDLTNQDSGQSCVGLWPEWELYLSWVREIHAFKLITPSHPFLYNIQNIKPASYGWRDVIIIQRRMINQDDVILALTSWAGQAETREVLPKLQKIPVRAKPKVIAIFWIPPSDLLKWGKNLRAVYIMIDVLASPDLPGWKQRGRPRSQMMSAEMKKETKTYCCILIPSRHFYWGKIMILLWPPWLKAERSARVPNGRETIPHCEYWSGVHIMMIFLPKSQNFITIRLQTLYKGGAAHHDDVSLTRLQVGDLLGWKLRGRPRLQMVELR